MRRVSSQRGEEEEDGDRTSVNTLIAVAILSIIAILVCGSRLFK